MKLIVGLGNPGQEYEKTRHSIGFFLIDGLVPGTFKYDEKYKSELYKDQDAVYLKPMEFMNRSGGAVSKVANFYKIAPKDILIIHDDIDLPVAKIQLKLGGSSAGHNGLKDIIAMLGTKEFYRLRIGVDRPKNQDDARPGHSSGVADYVLSSFKKEEKNLISEQMNHIHECISQFLSM